MSHNTPIRNAEFALTFCETNLRYLLGATVRDEALIAKTKGWIEERKLEIAKLQTNPANEN